MLTNECHECENYIEFPDHGVGQQIKCPHCGLPVVLTPDGKTAPPEPAKDAELAHMLESLNAPDEKERKKPLPAGSLKLWLGIAAIIALIIPPFLLVERHQRKEELAAVHEAAITRLAQDAAAAHAPTGLLGAKWLMSPKEVMKAVPGAKEIGPGALGETARFYDRPAQISYQFTNDALLLISISFIGSSSPTDFAQTQARLVMDYGPMPRPAASAECTLASVKHIGHFVVQHCLSQAGATATERVFFYIRGRANPPGASRIPQ
jgi:hypothetical protein